MLTPLRFFLVNVGDYIEAVLDRNLAENISRVLYPNDNVSSWPAQTASLSGLVRWADWLGSPVGPLVGLGKQPPGGPPASGAHTMPLGRRGGHCPP